MSASIEAIPTEYDYDFLPKTMFVGATADATLTIINPDRDPPPQEERSIAVRIPVGGENGLVDTLLGTTVSTSNPKWLATTFWNEPTPYVLLSGPALEPFIPLTVTFSTLHVSRVPGPVALEARELFGPQGSKALPVIKQLDGLKINLIYVSPGTVTDGDQTTLLWDVSGGAYVMIRPGEIKRPVSGGRFTDSLKMDVLAPQTTYTLELWTNDRQFVTSQATADVGRVTAGLTATPPGPVDVDTQTTLAWTSSYARVPILLSTPKNVFREPKTSGSRQVTLADYVTGNQSEIPFELSADGYPQPATRRVAVTLNKLRVRWLRYTDPAKTQFNFSVVNHARPGWPRTSTVDKLTTLTSDGPGGPVTAYLGTGPALQVQYMNATPNPAPPGATVTVTYETLNAVSAKLALRPGTEGQTVPLTNQQGIYLIVAPAASTTLVLTVTNANGSVSSEFDLVVKAA